MAIGTPTLAVAATTQGAGQTTTSGSFTPAVGDLLLAHFEGVDAAAPGVPTISDSGGLTWTLVASTGGTFNATNRCITVWAVAAAAAAMTVSADWGASIAGSCCAVTKISGTNTTTPILAGSNAGATGSSTTPAPGTVPAITSGNVQMLWVATRAASATQEAGWTELYDASNAGACTIAAYYNTTGDTSPTATTASAPWRAGAVEIAAAAASGGGVGTNQTAAQRSAAMRRRRR